MPDNREARGNRGVARIRAVAAHRSPGGWHMADKEAQALAARLAGFQVFSGCSSSDLTSLAVAGRITNLPAGWPFVTQGEPADACYIILEGSARVFFARQE